MKKKTKDNDQPIGRLKRIEDFLPAPDKLVFPRRTLKVTIALDEDSVEFFKKQAKRHRTKYQRMIRALLDAYARRYS
jgi:predicted DNA binding CopG/RHH family protein